MTNLRNLPLTAVVALIFLGAAPRAEERPQLFPTQDVDITYDVTRPQQPKVRQRFRWLAAELPSDHAPQPGRPYLSYA